MTRRPAERGATAVVLATAVAAAGCADPSPPEPEAAAPPPAPAVIRFVNVADEAGLRAVQYCGGDDKDHLLESTGSGAAWLDYDGDGRLDAYLVNAWALGEEPSAVRVRGRNALYRNLGDGRFEDVTEAAGVGDDGWGAGVAVADFDRDGHVDLYVTNFGPNRLYRARGDGTFEEIAERAGVADPGWGAGASFFDADGDGHLDLYVANYIECTMEEVLAARRTNTWRSTAKTMAGPFGMRGGRDRFYRNNGDGTFRDATDEAGLTDEAEAYGLGVLAADLDLDGDVDLYVANDSNPNFLYRNEGDGTFTDVGPWSGAAFSADGAAQAGMGVDAADCDGDGLPEIIVTNFARDHCTLYHNLGDLYFEDRTADHDLKSASHEPLSWGCAFLDVDRDADVDLFIVNGHIYPQVDDFPQLEEHYRQRPQLYRNDDGRLVHVSDEAGPALDVARSGRGIAVGDYDGDGDLDLLLTAMDEPPALLRNESGPPGHWLALRLLDRHGAPAINARAVVETGGVRQSREVRSGSTYQSQNATDLHFGLGAAPRAARIEIIWPGGGRTELTDVEADRVVTVREGETG
jgi:hypothetical protein